jgi:hypothetical protein
VGEGNVWIAAARLLYCFNFTEDKVMLYEDARKDPLISAIGQSY